MHNVVRKATPEEAAAEAVDQARENGLEVALHTHSIRESEYLVEGFLGRTAAGNKRAWPKALHLTSQTQTALPGPVDVVVTTGDLILPQSLLDQVRPRPTDG
jgi:hypothetical protein